MFSGFKNIIYTIMSKTCLTCVEETFDETENVIPKWSQKMGNYSPLPPPLNCNSKYNAGYKDNLKNFKKITPKKIGEQISVSVDTKKPLTWIFYWAANPSKNDANVVGAIDAYGDFKNHGLQKTDSKGKAELLINCPQLYKVEGKIYPRHLHYVLLNDDKTWDYENVKTSKVSCLEEEDTDEDKDSLETNLQTNTFRGWGNTFYVN